MQCVWKEGGCELYPHVQHVAIGCMADVQECDEVWQEWHKVLCAKCVKVKGERQVMSFALKMLS